MFIAPNGTATGGGLNVNSATTFARIQGGTATLGVGSVGVNILTVTFPAAFSAVPKVIATPRSGAFADTFDVTTRAISTTQFVVNIYRADANVGWAQSLKLDWFAWE